MTETAKTEIATPEEYTVPDAPSSVALTPMDMIDRALSSGAGVEVIERLMGLQERWEANQGRKAFDYAIAQAKAEIPPIIKNREVDFTNKAGVRTHYRHEDLAQIARVVDPILSKYGLSYRYSSKQEGEKLFVTCILSHQDGYSEDTTLSAANDQSGNKNPIQGVGSTATFLQRYTLKLALGLAAAADDDGNAATKPVETVNEEQFHKLRELLEQTGTPESALLGYYRVGTLDLFPAEKFNGAVKFLEAKRKKGSK